MWIFLKWLLGLVALLMLAVAAGLVAFWAPDRSVESLVERWAPPPSQFLAVGGMQVHVRDVGPRDDPHPVVLLHGTSASLHTWEGWVPELSRTRRVVSLDLPGFGLTGPFPDDTYAIGDYARFMGELMDALALPPAVLVGNSFGGQVALEVALTEPGRVHQLVLVDALAYPRASESVPLGFVLAATPGVNRLLKYVLPRDTVEQGLRDVYGDPGRVTPALVDRYYELTLRAGNRAALPKRLRHLPTEASAARLAQIRQPTLILWGGRDQLIPLAQGQRLHADIAGSQLVVFPSLGHVPHEEDPALTLAAVQAFLGQSADPAAAQSP
jgi:pimeloyl-ACP methyl ester carboxylesterase